MWVFLNALYVTAQLLIKLHVIFLHVIWGKLTPRTPR